jgi:hypothetical protein
VQKILSKVLANRLQPFMPPLIKNNQAAFIPGRCITETFAAAQILVHQAEKRKQKVGRKPFQNVL